MPDTERDPEDGMTEEEAADAFLAALNEPGLIEQRDQARADLARALEALEMLAVDCRQDGYDSETLEAAFVVLADLSVSES